MIENEAEDIIAEQVTREGSLPPAPFWMVLGQEQGSPVVRHASRAGAEREARRLARHVPGVVFIVLEAVSASLKRDLETITFKSEGSSF